MKLFIIFTVQINVSRVISHIPCTDKFYFFFVITLQFSHWGVFLCTSTRLKLFYFYDV